MVQPKQEVETHAQDKSLWWVETCIWTENMLRALSNERKGMKWFSLIDKVYAQQTLNRAWEQVRKNKGAAGVDKVTVERFEANHQKYIAEIQKELQEGTYRPQPVKRVEIPKGDGKTRPLGIPVVKDRLVQTAIKLVIEPIFETKFSPKSYGFRPGRSAKDALRHVEELLKSENNYALDADFQGYFDSIPHDRLMERVRSKISDGRLLDLIERFLKQPIMAEMNSWIPDRGTPQGGVLSPLLANIYLDGLDTFMEEHGYEMIRYADDSVVLCPTREKAVKALALMQEWSTQNGLTIHPDKVHVGDWRQKGEGFEFLGYRFERGLRLIRKQSIKKFRDTIRSKTKRNRPGTPADIAKELNRILKGWFGYFKHAQKTYHWKADSFVRRRLRALFKRRLRLRGYARDVASHQRWPNKYFEQLGLFSLKEAHAAALSVSRAQP